MYNLKLKIDLTNSYETYRIIALLNDMAPIYDSIYEIDRQLSSVDLCERDRLRFIDEKKSLEYLLEDSFNSLKRFSI